MALRRISWGTTLVLILPAVLLVGQGISVLYLFLIADLWCSAAVVPVFYGLYVRRFSATAAVISTLVGLGVGAWRFPWWFPEPGGDFLPSFGGALLASAGMAILLSRWGWAYDFSRMREAVQALHE